MNKALKTGLPIAGAVLAAAGLTLFAAAPEPADYEKKAPFLGRNIAHRGLHRKDRSVPENSLAAFRSAVDRGYGVEFDVHLTADGRLVVFHDDELSRMCGVEGRIEDFTLAQLRKLRLAGTQEGIPLLSEVLAVVDGKTPIILELKRGHDNRQLCERVRELLLCYRGSVCIESFDPFIVGWWRKNAPEVLRGQLSCTAKDFGSSTSRLRAFILSRLLTNFISRPNFIAYGICPRKPLTVRLCEKLGAMKVAWTSRDWLNEDGNDSVIFEFYRPRTKFR